jgi:hypothetical protein
MTTMAVIWLAMASAVLGLALYRKLVSRDESDILHVRDAEAGMIKEQSALAIRLDQVDKWGKSLTVVAIVFGMALAVAFLYQQWLLSFRLNP